MAMRPTVSLSIKQKTAPRILMRQLVKLLPMNNTQLQENIRQEVESNPFLAFPVGVDINRNDIDIDSIPINSDAYNESQYI